MESLLERPFHANGYIQKCQQYDLLTARCLSLAKSFKETGKPNLTRTFMNVDGEHCIVQVSPRMLHTLAKIRDRSFNDYLVSKRGD